MPLCKADHYQQKVSQLKMFVSVNIGENDIEYLQVSASYMSKDIVHYQC